MTRLSYVGVLLMLFSVQTDAAVIEFFDRATFNATVPGVVTFDFETASGFPLATAPLDFIDATIDLSTSGGDSFVQVQDFGNGFGQAIGGSTGDEVDNFLPVVVTFGAPYYAVGFDDLDLTELGVIDEYAIIQVSFSGGTVGYLRTDPDGDFSTAPFFGIWSTERILGLRVWSASTPTGEPGTRANLIDNLSVSRIAAAPEPSSLLLIGAGLLAVARMRRRKSARA